MPGSDCQSDDELDPDGEIEAWIERLKQQGVDLRERFSRPEVQDRLREIVARHRRAPD